VKIHLRAYIKPYILLYTFIILGIYECRGTRLRRWLSHSAASRKVAVSIPDEVLTISGIRHIVTNYGRESESEGFVCPYMT